MFGIGFGELMVIAVVILIAVGPRRLPTLMKSLGRAMREFRKATRELRSQVGLDEIMDDEDLRNPMPDLRRILADEPTRKPKPKLEPKRTRAPGAGSEDDADADADDHGEGISDPPDEGALASTVREYPVEGVDVAEAERGHEKRRA